MLAGLIQSAASAYAQKSTPTSAWKAKRFLKHPRFAVYLQGDRQFNLEKQNFISLNHRVIEFLANQNGTDTIDQPETYVIS